MKKTLFLLFIAIFSCNNLINSANKVDLDQYNVTWTTQSKNSLESMPCGGGDIGTNVWVENGEIMFYLSKSGTFDENNTFLKLGRVRIHLSPNPFEGKTFKQELILKDGYVQISGFNANLSADVKLWVDVFNPVISVEINSNQKINVDATYENWRYQDRELRKGESFQNTYKWAPPKDLKTLADQISFKDNGVLFYHRNKPESVFDATVDQQGLSGIKDQLYNPLLNLTFGGYMTGKNFNSVTTTDGTYLDTDFKGWKLQSKEASKTHQLKMILHSNQTKTIEDWQTELWKTVTKANNYTTSTHKKTIEWWNQYWDRSFIQIESDKDQNSQEWQVGKNYQLFRYMLGCNAYGNYPTKFNGGLFTVDPVFVDAKKNYTPDFRNWGGGTFTAQNQRLVYFPMLKCGDFDMMKPQFDFYLRILNNAILRSKTYWGHDGACFTEQIENFGLPNPSEYGWKRPDWYDKGMQYNAWLEYQWDTVLEICYMILQTERYNNNDISEYIPLIESCLTFFDEHYQYLAKQRGSKTYDANNHLVFYPGSSCETYKMSYNSTSTIAALQTVLKETIALPEKYMTQEQKDKWSKMLEHIPPISFTDYDGHKTIAPAKLWERVNNVEVPQLYPVYPWGIYGVGKPDLEVAVNTWKYDPDANKFRSHIGWKQDNIFAARLGLTNEASELVKLKLKDSDRRFSAFWGPGYDWVPDHNWGGSGMIGLQEMLLQTNDKEILLFPAWPKDWDVHFKLYAPDNTTVEAKVKNGKIEYLNVEPKEREKDIVNYLK